MFKCLINNSIEKGTAILFAQVIKPCGDPSFPPLFPPYSCEINQRILLAKFQIMLKKRKGKKTKENKRKEKEKRKEKQRFLILLKLKSALITH